MLSKPQEAMSRHVASTSTVHIHVLSVHRQCRQQGKGSILLWRYLQYLRCMATPRRALLICEDYLVPFYLKAGFKEKGPSAISVSNMRFQEMEYLLAGQAYARRNSGC
ncbi:serotonin N-acetyltransferase-like [Nerophis ophidion]|uniref:serotonin N-acetyltransferase-like n=1 Tax=Nerophis ophidion TaxID=159077 RepID=UPI002ADF513B|nr:serotonin N-acetyltransferase-like [Nerophis ophidion]